MFTISQKKVMMILSFFAFTLLFINPMDGNAQVLTDQWEESLNEKSDKTWTVQFSNPVDPESVHADSIYVVDQFQEKQKVTLIPDKNQVVISPPQGGYKHSTTYTLHITNNIKDENGNPLSTYIQKKFTIETPETYDVMDILSDGSTNLSKSYFTYAEALQNMNTNQAIQFKDSLIKIPAGLVVTKATSSSSLTIVYSNEQLTKVDTYLPANTELLYIDSTNTYVEVNVAGQNKYIKQVNSYLIPWNAVTDRSYYSASNGNLVHSIYSHSAKKYESYQVGDAPEFMGTGEKYYSVDGAHFTDAFGLEIGTSYPYFQYLSARSQTNYTAEEIDTYILTRLDQLESDYPNSTIYQQASTKSKLIGLGTYLKEMEEKYQVNALLILALAQHESTYGLSERAQQFNNLFGLYVTDDNPLAKVFDTIEQNIDELVTVFLNKNYIPPNALYANGAVFGNKSIGFNVKYAADPYWGAKAAGHMYRIDQMMGGKDSINPHKLGITTTSGLNVRTDPSTQNSVAYRYIKSNVPLIILDDNLPETDWIKVLSDSAAYEELYIHRDYIRELPVK